MQLVGGGISCDWSSYNTIDGCTVQDVGNGINEAGINLDSSDHCIVKGCIVWDENITPKTVRAISEFNVSNYNIITGNEIIGNWNDASKLLKVGVDSIAAHNIPLDTGIKRHLSSTANWDPPSISNGTATSTTVTVTNAVVGDTVAVGFSVAVPGRALLVGAVTAADTVTVTLANHTGGTLNLASGTLRADVWQH